MNVTLPNGQASPRSETSTDKIQVSSSVSPNPASVVLNIKVSNLVDATYGFELLDMNGRSLLQKSDLNSSYSIDTSDFVTGLYFCRISDEDGQLIAVHKVYIQ